uniref:Uncharacterized protein n=1 Tax=Lactuca sativa TaxID=4236 RepID=A0A9R1XM90_LACSA|nr:hypothetical protein LSAT_V11C300152750 [Lactuca sativa]
MKGLDSPLKTYAPSSSKWLEPYRITITNGNLPELVVGCDNQGTQLMVNIFLGNLVCIFGIQLVIIIDFTGLQTTLMIYDTETKQNKMNNSLRQIFGGRGLDSPVKTKAPPSSKWLEPYRITITNGNLPELVVSCDDQGTQLLRPGEQLSWKFRMNFLDTTSYICRFYWFANNTNDIRYQVEVPVFKKDIIRLCGSYLFHMSRCYWYVTQTEICAGRGLDSPLKTKAPPSSKWLEPYRITITNGNLPELVVGCDDQGTQLLRPGEQLSWKFRMNFWDTTSYNCRFYWFTDNSNDIRYQVEVPVFNKDIIRTKENKMNNNLRRMRCVHLPDSLFEFVEELNELALRLAK